MTLTSSQVLQLRSPLNICICNNTNILCTFIYVYFTYDDIDFQLSIDSVTYTGLKNLVILEITAIDAILYITILVFNTTIHNILLADISLSLETRFWCTIPSLPDNYKLCFERFFSLRLLFYIICSYGTHGKKNGVDIPDLEFIITHILLIL